MRSAEISGISPNFLELSQSQGQVAHVLLTRSPLEHPPEGGVSFDLHVLSTPPAFVLSQDQTLRRCSTQAENRDLTIAESINPKKPTRKTPKGPPGREYYLALTFGTLLSSQGADAHQIHPSGLHRWRLVQPYAATGNSPRGVSGWPLGPARRVDEDTPSPGSRARGFRTVQDRRERSAQRPRKDSIPTVRPG